MKEALHHETSMPSEFNKKNVLLFGFIGVLVALFAVSAITSLTQGGHHVWGTSHEVPWGFLITGYVFFAVGCTGICLVSSLGHVFHVKAFHSMGIRPAVLAVMSMITAFIVIALEMKYPLNLMIYMVFSPNITSPFILMGLLYSIYLVCLILEIAFYAIGKEKWSRLATIFAIITGVSASANLGLVFGGQVGRAFWNAPMFPILLISSALVSGAASLIILYYFVDRADSKLNKNFLVEKLSKLLGGFIVLFGAISAFNLYNSLNSPSLERQEAARFLLSGDYSISFWVFEVAFLVIPLIIVLFFSKKQLWVMLSSVMALIGLAFSRQNQISAGQIVSLSPDGQSPIKLLEYFPTWVELGIVVGGLGVVILGYLVLERVVVFAKEKLSGKFS